AAHGLAPGGNALLICLSGRRCRGPDLSPRAMLGGREVLLPLLSDDLQSRGISVLAKSDLKECRTGLLRATTAVRHFGLSAVLVRLLPTTLRGHVGLVGLLAASHAHVRARAARPVSVHHGVGRIGSDALSSVDSAGVAEFGVLAQVFGGEG